MSNRILPLFSPKKEEEEEEEIYQHKGRNPVFLSIDETTIYS